MIYSLIKNRVILTLLTLIIFINFSVVIARGGDINRRDCTRKIINNKMAVRVVYFIKHI